MGANALCARGWLPFAPSHAHRRKTTPPVGAALQGCFTLSPRWRALVNEIADWVADLGQSGGAGPCYMAILKRTLLG